MEFDLNRTDNRTLIPLDEQRSWNPVFARAYAADLEGSSRAYVIAADAPGLRKDAARFLYAESLRLHREFLAWSEHADEIEDTYRPEVLRQF